MEPNNLILLEPKSKIVSLKMSDNNWESDCQGNLPIADLRKWLESLRSGNGGPLSGVVGANLTPTGADLTNFLLIEPAG